EPALLPWLTVERNVELPLRLRRLARGERRHEVERLLTLVNLLGFEKRRPHELSGGMRQRVALARALAQNSDVLLMDEPFAAVDAITRDVLHEDLTQIWELAGITVIFVTHNVREAVRLGDRVVLMSSRPGKVAHTWWVDIPRPRRIEPAGGGALSRAITEGRRGAGWFGGGRWSFSSSPATCCPRRLMLPATLANSGSGATLSRRWRAASAAPLWGTRYRLSSEPCSG